ncbi:MAG: hypoxanthine phosphoribosyltransferase [Bdellovibrionales bacterium]|nr:hypoxanthine phosphoribosyltransferase [Bdellovibrionales bacterium]
MIHFDERQFRSFMSEDEVLAAVDSLAEQINRDYGINDRLLLVGVLKGAFMVMADLVRRLHSDTEVEFVRAQSIGKGAHGPGTVCLVKDVGLDVSRRHVIIVEEIIDSGRTLKYLHDRLKSAQPLSLKIATLLDKRQKRVAKIDADYVGRLVDDQFLIGYGLDLEERCRNLRNIYALKYPN